LTGTRQGFAANWPPVKVIPFASMLWGTIANKTDITGLSDIEP
jgi:hypothetical protein